MFENLSPNVKAAILTAAVAITLAAFGGFYTIGYRIGANDYDNVQKFKNALPDMMTNLGTLAKGLSSSVEMVERDRRLTEDMTKANQENQRLQQAVKDQVRELDARQKRISDLEAQVAQLIPSEEIKV